MAEPPPLVCDVDDFTLMQRIALGDMAALATLVRRHEKRIRTIAFRFVGNGADADDIAQECFLRVWHSAKGYQPHTAFMTWLYRVVVNLCLDQKRRQRRSPKSLDGYDDVATDAPPTPLEQAETVLAVRAAIRALPERQRMAVLLHRYDGLSHHEIADVTGWSESAVESLLSRAYAALRQSLTPRA